MVGDLSRVMDVPDISPGPGEREGGFKINETRAFIFNSNIVRVPAFIILPFRFIFKIFNKSIILG